MKSFSSFKKQLINEDFTSEETLHDHEHNLPTIDKWKKVGRNLGSNPGGVYADENGKKWYVKHSHTNDHARNEHTANRLYNALGVHTLEPQLIKVGTNKLGLATPWVDKIKNFDPENEEEAKQVRSNFAAHALLSNWDTIGLQEHEHDHNQGYIPERGAMATLDAGGALNYRAMGSPKGNAFGHEANEWDTLRHPSKYVSVNSSHRVFGKMAPHEMVESARVVGNLANEHIKNIVEKHGPGNPKEKEELKNKLISRKKDIIMRANALASQHGLQTVKDIDND
jgi:hypothetical protein